MAQLPDVAAVHGAPVLAKDMVAALTAGELVFEGGATQTFDAGGATTFVEHGRPSTGEWSVIDDGQFSSFWPPSYRATYDLRWVVEDGRPVGLTFTDGRGERFSGRYR